MQSSAASTRPSGVRPRRWLLFVVPLALFVLVGVAFDVSLHRDPRILPSPLIGKPAPNFNLPPAVPQSGGLKTADLMGKVSLVNVFASWCVSCRDEHPLLLQLHKSGDVPVYGIDYKDKPADASRWLSAMGDPYSRIGGDASGRVAINWGVYGVPETFVVGPSGRIAYKQVGPITAQVLNQTILPLVARLRQTAAAKTRN